MFSRLLLSPYTAGQSSTALGKLVTVVLQSEPHLVENPWSVLTELYENLPKCNGFHIALCAMQAPYCYSSSKAASGQTEVENESKIRFERGAGVRCSLIGPDIRARRLSSTRSESLNFAISKASHSFYLGGLYRYKESRSLVEMSYKTAWSKSAGSVPSDRLAPRNTPPKQKAANAQRTAGSGRGSPASMPRSKEVLRLESLRDGLQALVSSGRKPGKDPKGGCFCQGV